MSLASASELYSWLGISSTKTADDIFLCSVVMAAADRIMADFLGYSPAEATRTEYYPARVNMTQRESLIDGWERGGGNKVVPVERYQSERRVIALRHIPVTQIVSVYENPDAWLTDPADFPAANLLTAGSDYYLDMHDDTKSLTGFLIRATGPWSAADRCVKVTYTAGYSAVQLAGDYGTFRYAYLVQCQVMYNTAKIQRMAGKLGSMPGILASESLGDWSASYDTLTAQKLYGYQNKVAPAVAEILEKSLNYSAYL